MDVIEREEIAEVLRQQPDILKQDAFDLLTVSDVIGLHVPYYVHKALPLRDAFFIGLNPQWVDFFDNLDFTYCKVIANMHKEEILENHLHPSFLNDSPAWYENDSDLGEAYTVLRGICGWAAEAHDEITEALIDVSMGIPAGQTMYDRRLHSHGNVINLKDFRLRSRKNASLH
jgi:hypothetical protein